MRFLLLTLDVQIQIRSNHPPLVSISIIVYTLFPVVKILFNIYFARYLKLILNFLSTNVVTFKNIILFINLILKEI